MPETPPGARRTPLVSYSWGGVADLSAFRDVFQPDAGIFSPNYPLVPTEAEDVRVWDFPVGRNLTYTPRAYEPVSFAQLKALADNHDITRLAIETRKDQIEALDWTIRSRAGKAAPQAAHDRAARLAAFWAYPDGDHDFATWVRQALEQVLVLDAPAFEIRRNRGGEVIGFDVVDGATIDVLIDNTGRVPMPPAPAYEQVIHGRPWKLLSRDQLLYLPRNPRPGRLYGFGPVEQIVMTVNTALRRQIMQLQHYTEGNVPPGLLSAPDGWNPEQIRQFQEWFDSVLAGNTAARTRLVWAPAGAKYQAFKEPPVKDEQDEWFARVVCYAFSLPPTAFTRQVNRATAETAQEAALSEGLAPLKRYVKRLVDTCLRIQGADDVEFGWVEEQPLDPEAQAKVLDTYLRNGAYTLNEARDTLGLDPVEGGDGTLIYTAAGPVTLASVLAGDRAVAEDAAPSLPNGSDDPQPGVGKRSRGPFAAPHPHPHPSWTTY